MDHARHCAVLWFAEIQNRKLFLELGYSPMRQYATTALKFSSSRCGDFLRLAGILDTLPAVRDSLADGTLGYTKAAQIIKVATPKTAERWVETAKRTGRRALAQTVKSVQQKARHRADPNQGRLLDQPETDDLHDEVPVRLTIEMTPLQFARYEALIEALHQQGRGAPDRADALLAGLDEARRTSEDVTECETTSSEDSARRRATPSPVRIHIHRCPECEKTTVQTSRGEMAIGDAPDDAVIVKPGRRNHSTIPPKLRESIFARARNRCESPGCGNTRFLEIHHVIPRARGGTNAPENLRVLCSACHRFHHRHGASIIGTRSSSHDDPRHGPSIA